MKKFLRFLLVLIVIVVAGILIIGLMEPTDVKVTRSVMIKAPKEAVFEQIVNFKNWTNWSPWYKMDSTMKLTYSGTDGQPGSAYHWIGIENKTGEGDMKNVAVNGTTMDYQLIFSKPHKGEAKGVFKAEDTAGMTRATWTMESHMSYPMNAMLLFMNMDKMLGGDFESGLNTMKQYVESHPVIGAVEIKEVDYPAHVFEGMRKTVNWNDMSKFFMDSYTDLSKGVSAKINGPKAGLYYTWDTVKKCSDMIAAFPVSDTTMAVKGAAFTHVGPSKAYMAVQNGPYSNSMKVHMALAKEIAAKGKTRTLVVEEYVVGPNDQADSTKWVTNIYYLVN